MKKEISIEELAGRAVLALNHSWKRGRFEKAWKKLERKIDDQIEAKIWEMEDRVNP